jgi:uncharacterized protein (TIGR02145 family)
MKSAVFLVLLSLLAGCSNEFVKYHGHQYKVIKAEYQYWMAENLATNTYRNGQKIPFIKTAFDWKDVETPGCGYYNNDTSMLRKYGMFYNWYAVETGKLCPFGWRVASNDDWNNLEKILGGSLRAGGKMTSVAGWEGKHVSADDIGFNALPAGYRLNEDFIEGHAALWWSSTPVDNKWVWGRRIDAGNTELMNTLNNRQNGFSVRCVRTKKVKFSPHSYLNSDIDIDIY